MERRISRRSGQKPKAQENYTHSIAGFSSEKVENPVENVNNRPLKGLFFKSFAVWRTYIAVLEVYIRLSALYKSVKKVEDFAANFVQQ